MCAVTSPSEAEAAVRTHGAARIVFRNGEGRTRLARLYQRAPLRVLFPAGGEHGVSTAVLVTTTGGLVGGDRLEARVSAEEGAAVLVTSQAAEKVYRSLGPCSRVDIELSAAPGSWLEWLPHETILFEGARLDRTTRIEHAPGAQVLAGEMLVFGRRAHREMLTRGRFRDAWEVRREGRLIWADALAATGDLAAVLAMPACLAGAAAVATALYVGDAVQEAVDLARDLTAATVGSDMAIAVTCVAGVLICRWLGRDPHALRGAFGRFWAAFRHRIGGLPSVVPRVWSA
jgi:urease accessory protein